MQQPNHRTKKLFVCRSDVSHMSAEITELGLGKVIESRQLDEQFRLEGIQTEALAHSLGAVHLRDLKRGGDSEAAFHCRCKNGGSSKSHS